VRIAMIHQVVIFLESFFNYEEHQENKQTNKHGVLRQKVHNNDQISVQPLLEFSWC
jgi:hypothetical protein